MGRLLGARGRVLPMALTPMDITATVRGLDPADPAARSTVRGQVEVATTEGEIVSVAARPGGPARPAPRRSPRSRDADWVVLGPGSWFTSVHPAPAWSPSCAARSARPTPGVVVVLNLEEQEGETAGFAPEDHLAALLEHAPELRVHTVLADRGSVSDVDQLEQAVASYGAHLVVADVALGDGTPRHDPVKLADAFGRILDGRPRSWPSRQSAERVRKPGDDGPEDLLDPRLPPPGWSGHGAPGAVAPARHGTARPRVGRC